MSHRHYSLGLTDRDRVNQSFGGGLPRGSLTVIVGEHGAGKSVLSQRLAYGIASEGTATTYVSTDLTAPGFVEQLHSLSYDVVDLLLEERLLFLHANVDTHVPDGDAMRGEREVLSRLCRPSVVWQADVVVVDGFGAMLRNDPRLDAIAERGEEDHAIQGLVTFLRRATAAGKSVVLTLDPSGLSERGLRPLYGAADVLLSIQTTAVGQELRRSILVRRFAGVASPIEDTIGFSVQQGRGIIIESRTVA